MKNKKPVLIIDGNNMCHRAYHNNSGLSYKGQSVASIFGVPSMVRTLITKFKPRKVLMVWDGARHYRRLELVPGYKSHRAKQKRDDFDFDDFNYQKGYVQKILHYLGVVQVRNSQTEADDIIYMLSQKYLGVRPVIICSNDKDFHQLICEGVSQYVDKPTMRELITIDNFADHIPVHPTKFVDYLCLLGDDSDDIPGYHGVGPVKAAKFLGEWGYILDFLEDRREDKFINRQKLKELYNINREMIDLEYFFTKNLRGMEIEYLFDSPKPKPNKIRLDKVCFKFNLKTFRFKTFMEAFQLTQPKLKK